VSKAPVGPLHPAHGERGGAAQRFGLTSGASGGPLVPEGTCLGCDVPVCWAKENLSFLFLYSPSGSRWSALPRPGAARGLLNDSVGQERGSQRGVFGATPLALVVLIGEREETEVMAGRAVGRRRNHIPYQQCAWVVGLRSSMYARHLRCRRQRMGTAGSFSRVGIAETGAGLDGSRPRETGTTGIA
jgi:hypothetical protein